MRILPRIHFPRSKRIARRLRYLRRVLTVAGTVLVVELLCFALVLLFAFTGSRAAFVDRIGRRADLMLLAVLLGFFALLHFVVKRRIVPAIERRFSPAAYDERRILFDLGQEARAAINTDQLYKSIVERIGDALQAENVSIFVRDDVTSNYVCRIGAPHAANETGDKDETATGPRLVLARDAFVVRRLQHLAAPLVL